MYFLKHLEIIYKDDRNISFKGKCDQLMEYLNKIEVGYKIFLENQLGGVSQSTQEVFHKLLNSETKKELYAREEINNIAKQMKIDGLDITKTLKELKYKDLIEKRYYIKQFKL